MTFTRFSKKQLEVFRWWLSGKHDAIIADGAIRSGKTLSMSISFVLWATRNFNRQTFAFAGKTIESLRRNVIVPLTNALPEIFTVKEYLARNYAEVSCGSQKNRFYFFGGKDESSYMLIQGITLAGIMFDEVALMPQSFVEQALARCSVAGSKFWFNCNPGSPEHWFYKNWISEENHATKKIKYLRFTMDDNLSMDESIRDRYRNLYEGVFYDRYILGLWTLAEGVIYSMFNKDKHTVDASKMKFTEHYVSIDYGTVNPFAALLWGRNKDQYVCERELYYDSRKEGLQKTDEEYYRSLETFIGDTPVTCIVVDPSATSFIECIRRHGKFRVIPADNAVEDGIRNVSTMLNLGTLLFSETCEKTIAEFGLYVWDKKSGEKGIDKPTKEHDHAMDAVRYFVQTIVQKLMAPIGFSIGLSKESYWQN